MLAQRRHVINNNRHVSQTRYQNYKKSVQALQYRQALRKAKQVANLLWKRLGSHNLLSFSPRLGRRSIRVFTL